MQHILAFIVVVVVARLVQPIHDVACVAWNRPVQHILAFIVVVVVARLVQPIHDVGCVAWNRQVQHILASSHGGSCVVWDLRKNEPIIKIRDSMSRVHFLIASNVAMIRDF